MSELRAPDPTLAASGDTWCAIAWPDGEDGPAVACVATPTHFLGKHHLRHWTTIPLRDAAHVAVPCLECFPDAPDPAQRWRGTRWGDLRVAEDDPHLAWQTPDGGCPATYGR